MPSTLIDRRRVLTAGAALTIAPLAGRAAHSGGAPLYDSPEGAKPLYTRAELEGFVDRYLQALVAHDAARRRLLPRRFSPKTT
jgi:hypothetical protein